MNNLASSLVAGLRPKPAFVAPGFHTTRRIDRSSFTRHVRTIQFAFTSLLRVVIRGHDQRLVETPKGKPFICADRMGHGVFVLSGDSNVFSDNTDTGYSKQGNGALVHNLCAFPPS
jgi:hypothetical protein